MGHLAVVVSAVAAVGALYFAWRTVHETSSLRREDRLARVAELVGEFSGVVLRLHYGDEMAGRTSLAVARERLRGAIVAAGEPLPACTELVGLRVRQDRTNVPVATSDEIEAATTKALDEVTRLLRAERVGRNPITAA